MSDGDRDGGLKRVALDRDRIRERPVCDCPKAGPYACPHCGRAIAATSHVNRCHAAAVGGEQ